MSIDPKQEPRHRLEAKIAALERDEAIARARIEHLRSIILVLLAIVFALSPILTVLAVIALKALAR